MAAAAAAAESARYCPLKYELRNRSSRGDRGYFFEKLASMKRHLEAMPNRLAANH